MKSSIINSLIAHDSATRKHENQDYSISLEGKSNIIIVADGIGSLPEAKEGSKEVVKRAEELLRGAEVDILDLKELFVEIQNDLNKKILESGQNHAKSSYGTTLIIAIELEDRFKVAYVGNGAILHIRGNITKFREDVYYLPWVCTNYLNPHSEPYQGKEALNKHFGYNVDICHVEPTIIEISKDLNGPGDILVICTDGVYSIDQAEVSADEDAIVWIESPKSLQLLINEIKAFLVGEDHHNVGLERTIRDYLNVLKETDGQMTDDCTLGVIITEQALKFQKNI